MSFPRLLSPALQLVDSPALPAGQNDLCHRHIARLSHGDDTCGPLGVPAGGVGGANAGGLPGLGRSETMRSQTGCLPPSKAATCSCCSAPGGSGGLSAAPRRMWWAVCGLLGWLPLQGKASGPARPDRHLASGQSCRRWAASPGAPAEAAQGVCGSVRSHQAQPCGVLRCGDTGWSEGRCPVGPVGPVGDTRRACWGRLFSVPAGGAAALDSQISLLCEP